MIHILIVLAAVLLILVILPRIIGLIVLVGAILAWAVLYVLVQFEKLYNFIRRR